MASTFVNFMIQRPSFTFQTNFGFTYSRNGSVFNSVHTSHIRLEHILPTENEQHSSSFKKGNHGPSNFIKIKFTIAFTFVDFMIPMYKQNKQSLDSEL